MCVCFCYYYCHRCRIRSHQGYIIPSFIILFARSLARSRLFFLHFIFFCCCWWKHCTVGLLFSFQLFAICRMLYDFSVNVYIVLCHCLVLSNVVHRINWKGQENIIWIDSLIHVHQINVYGEYGNNMLSPLRSALFALSHFYLCLFFQHPL